MDEHVQHESSVSLCPYRSCFDDLVFQLKIMHGVDLLFDDIGTDVDRLMKGPPSMTRSNGQ